MGGQAAHPDDQKEEQNEEKVRENKRKCRRMSNDEENEDMFFSCPLRVESLATPLANPLPLQQNIYTTII